MSILTVLERYFIWRPTQAVDYNLMQNSVLFKAFGIETLLVLLESRSRALVFVCVCLQEIQWDFCLKPSLKLVMTNLVSNNVMIFQYVHKRVSIVPEEWTISISIVHIFSTIINTYY